MKTVVYLYITAGSVYGSEYVELSRDVFLPFTPSVGIKLQFSPLDFSENPDFVERMSNYDTLATGILSIDELYFHVEDGIFVATARESAGSLFEQQALADQWIHIYGMQKTDYIPYSSSTDEHEQSSIEQERHK